MEIKKYPFVTCSRETGSDIIFCEYSENLKIDLEIAKELVANRLDFTKNEMHYAIMDISNIKQYSKEAKAYMKSLETGAKNILGGAFIAHSPVSALLANIFIKTVNGVPTKFFFSKKEAIKWIHELKQKHSKNNDVQKF